MEQLFNGVIDRVRSTLGVETIKAIFGAKRRSFRHKRKIKPARVWRSWSRDLSMS